MYNRTSNGRGGGNIGNRPVCQYFLRGNCKFGDSCRQYHPPQNQGGPQSSNRFGTMPSTGAAQGGNPYMLNTDSVRSDLTDSKPEWPLSVYGPGKNAPRQLIEGAVEQSPEEIRVQYYLARASGNTSQYEATERAALQQAEAQVRQILNDVDGAVKYVIDGKDQHPNREDGTKNNAADFPWRSKSGVIQSTTTPSSVFGQPSGFGSSASGSSAFGRPTTLGSASAFGQASALGAGSAFGQPAPSSSAFGQTSNLGGGSAFGQPSALTSAFGKPSTLGTTSSAFGQPSPLGNAGSAFGQPSTLGSGSAFGQPSTLGKSNAFGQPAAPTSSVSPFATAGNAAQPSAFGQPTALGSGNGGFGQSSAFGNAVNTGTQNNASPFSTSIPQQPASGSAFGQPSPLGNIPSTNNTPGFGQPSNLNATNPPFGQTQPAPINTPAFGQSSAPAATNTTFGGSTSSKPSPFGTSAPAVQPASQSRPPDQATGPISTFKGRPVEYLRTAPDDPTDTSTGAFYVNDQGRKERVWMSNGPPGPNTETEGSPEEYEGQKGNLLKQIYDLALQSPAGFKDGFVPEIPPKREWIMFQL